MDRRSRIATLFSATVFLAACSERVVVELPEDVRRRVHHATPVPPVPSDPTNSVADLPAAAHLGRWLFFDPRISGPGTISCASCHDPSLAFSDGKPLGEGIAIGSRHTPSLLNVGHHRWLGWDGRSDSIWAQALRPMEHPLEMGGDRDAIAALVQRDVLLRGAYEAIFGELPEVLDEDAVMRVMANLGKALAAYQRTLVSGDAPFDRFVAGTGELSVAAQRGMALFFGEAECWECHAGPLLRDNEFHNIGIPPTGGGLPRDEGRFGGSAIVRDDPFNAAGAYSDAPEGAWANVVRSTRVDPESWGAFKTPSLRNVSRTAPYMHAGQMASLEEVLQFYSTLEGAVQLDHHQESVLVPLELSDQEKGDLLAFLNALEGTDPPEEVLHAPPSPAFDQKEGTDSP